MFLMTSGYPSFISILAITARSSFDVCRFPLMRRLWRFVPHLPLICRPLLPVTSRLQASQAVHQAVRRAQARDGCDTVSWGGMESTEEGRPLRPLSVARRDLRFPFPRAPFFFEVLPLTRKELRDALPPTTPLRQNPQTVAAKG